MLVYEATFWPVLVWEAPFWASHPARAPFWPFLVSDAQFWAVTSWKGLILGINIIEGLHFHQYWSLTPHFEQWHPGRATFDHYWSHRPHFWAMTSWKGLILSIEILEGAHFDHYWSQRPHFEHQHFGRASFWPLLVWEAPFWASTSWKALILTSVGLHFEDWWCAKKAQTSERKKAAPKNPPASQKQQEDSPGHHIWPGKGRDVRHEKSNIANMKCAM